MTFKKGTRYALYAAMEMARAGPEGQVTVTQVAARHGIRVSVLAKTFQALARAGIAVSARGVRGGYRLASAASQVTVLDVIDAFEGSRAAGCLLAGPGEADCNETSLCRLRRLVDEVNEMARCTYASVTLETLVGNRPPRSLELRVVR
jgi:Rrf2 family protein